MFDDNDDLLKYPRTPHLTGSRLQGDDTSEGQIPVGSLVRGIKVFEEKIDGSNTGISFSKDGDLRLQSRGHYLIGGWQERQFALFKAWANHHVDWLFDTLGNRYTMYGEWVYAKHTVFYDRLPHYFLEFDVYDRQQNHFLSTAARRRLFAVSGSPIVSVPVLRIAEGSVLKRTMQGLIGPSLYKSEHWQETLRQIAKYRKLSFEQAMRETDQSQICEGLYLKVEDGDKVIGRYKFVRQDFLQAILDSGTHWNKREILPNQLADGVNIFA